MTRSVVRIGCGELFSRWRSNLMFFLECITWLDVVPSDFTQPHNDETNRRWVTHFASLVSSVGLYLVTYGDSFARMWDNGDRDYLWHDLESGGTVECTC